MVAQFTHSNMSSSANPAKILLVIGATPASGWERLAPLFEHAGCTVAGDTQRQRWLVAARDGRPSDSAGFSSLLPTSMASGIAGATQELLNVCTPPVVVAADRREVEGIAEVWLQEVGAAHLLLLHSRPEAALLQAMRGQQDPAAVLAEWEAAANQAVQTYRRNRSRVSLIDVDCAVAAPGAFLRACKEVWGLDPKPFSGLPAAAADETAGIEHLLTAHMVSQSKRLGDLLAELEACSLPIGEPSGPMQLDCGRIYEDYQAQQAEMARLLKSREEQEHHAAELDAQLKEAARAQESLDAAHKETSQENELLLLQLHQVQEELESYYLQLQSTNEKLQKAEETIKNRDCRIWYMTHSKSWKLTAPIRAVKSLARRRSKAEAGKA